MHRRLARFVLAVSILSTAARAEQLAPGVELIRGSFGPKGQPDGNTIVFRGADGLVVVDTGRHPEHTQKVLDYAKRSGLPIAAIVNSHWHLDHVSGNPAIRSAYPAVRVHASSAIDDALKGFLARYRAQLEEMLGGAADEEQKSSWRAEIARIDSGRALAPDDVVAAPGVRTIAGRRLEVGLEGPAATAGDVWVFDPATRVLAAGDLVTVPVPFLDTACPEGWKTALAHVAKKDFRVLVPGHGAPMTRKAFETYRVAFGNFLACGSSSRPKEACVDGWMKDAASLVTEDDPKFVRSALDFYVGGVLRGDKDAIAKQCGK